MNENSIPARQTILLTKMTATRFFIELKNALPASTVADRKAWAAKIIAADIPLKNLFILLQGSQPVARRFSWLLTEIGEADPNRLFQQLPYLLELSDQIHQFDFRASFATYWRVAGIPPENEAQAIDWLFGWIYSAKTNVTTKSRALFVLFDLTKKYPDLKNELKLYLEDHQAKNSEDFRKRAQTILNKLEV